MCSSLGQCWFQLGLMSVNTFPSLVLDLITSILFCFFWSTAGFLPSFVPRETGSTYLVRYLYYVHLIVDVDGALCTAASYL